MSLRPNTITSPYKNLIGSIGFMKEHIYHNIYVLNSFFLLYFTFILKIKPTWCDFKMFNFTASLRRHVVYQRHLEAFTQLWFTYASLFTHIFQIVLTGSLFVASELSHLFQFQFPFQVLYTLCSKSNLFDHNYLHLLWLLLDLLILHRRIVELFNMMFPQTLAYN